MLKGKCKIKETPEAHVKAWVDKNGMKCMELRVRDWKDLEKCFDDATVDMVCRAWGVDTKEEPN